jgi:hypothetical protein
LEESYRYFANNQDRAGQHHSLEMALTMLDRARWTGKLEEAEVYRRWLVGKLNYPLTTLSKAKNIDENIEDSKRKQSAPVKLKLAA